MKSLLVAILLVAGLAGCAKNTAGLRIDGLSQKVLFDDKVMGTRLRIDDISTTQVNGHTRGVVTLTNHFQGNQNILYRFYWYNDQGLEVNSRPGPWQRLIIYGNETTSLSEVSVNPNGTQYRVQIRAAED